MATQENIAKEKVVNNNTSRKSDTNSTSKGNNNNQKSEEEKKKQAEEDTKFYEIYKKNSVVNTEPLVYDNKSLIVDDLKLGIKEDKIPQEPEYTNLSDGTGNTEFFFPNYSSNDYVKDRNSWKKQINNAYGGIGWFYFKVFFNFNTNYGLLGGILGDQPNSEPSKPSSVNTAIQYLDNISSLKMYNSEYLQERKKALKKFVKTLSYISSEAPWFFKEVSGFDNIKGAYLDDFNKDKVITIKTLEESIDMRLGTLFDLYKFSAYDNINFKEIIPQNLRKFEMSILIFNIPIKMHNTGFKNFDGTEYDPTKINNNELDSSMSFKMYTFQNCEFDVDSLNEVTDTISNENPFNMGANQIKIKYDRVYEHRMNEFAQYLFGPTGFYFDKSEKRENRKNALVDLDKSGGWGNVILSPIENEKICTDLFQAKFGPDAGLGNIYGTYTNPNSKYFNDKLKFIKNGTVSGNVFRYDFGPGTDYFNKKFESNIQSGNIYDRDFGPGTGYFDKKLKMNSDGTIKKGNIYDYKFGPGTDYFNLKLSKIKKDYGEDFVYGSGETVLDELYIKENNMISDNSSDSNELNIRRTSGNPRPNSKKLDWNSQAIRNTQNLYALDGNPSTATTFFGKMFETSWNKIKNSFKF